MKNTFIGYFDAGIIRQGQNSLDLTRGHNDPNAADKIPAFRMYVDKSGELKVANRFVSKEDNVGILEHSPLAVETIRNMDQVHEIDRASVGDWNKVITDPTVLGNPHEALAAAKAVAKSKIQGASAIANKFSPNLN